MTGVFYGWWIVAVAFLTHCVTVGLVFYSFGVFLPTLTAHFGWSRAEVSFGFSLVSLCAAVYAPFVGRTVDRFGPRPSQLFGAIVVALGFLLLRRVETLTEFYVLMGLVVSLGATSLGQLPSNAAVANWFVRRRGRALGISTTGISMGGVIFVPLSQFLIDRFGWRDAFGLLGILIVALVVPPVALVMRRSPEAVGLQPDGETVASWAEQGANPTDPVERSWTPSQAVRHRRLSPSWSRISWQLRASWGSIRTPSRPQIREVTGSGA
jgi:sugar phosphate permease